MLEGATPHAPFVAFQEVFYLRGKRRQPSEGGPRTEKDASAPGTVALLLALALKQWKHRLALVAAIVGYWTLYAFSAGMFFYYSFDLTPLLKSAQVPNPYFILESASLTGLYNSGMIWYPTNHLQVNLLYGPTFFSIILSVLFGLNMILLVHGFSFREPRSSLGLNGAVSMIPALFSGGCCAIPFGTVLLSSLIPATALSSFVYDYVLPTNILSVILMLAALLYSSKKLVRCCHTG